MVSVHVCSTLPAARCPLPEESDNGQRITDNEFPGSEQRAAGSERKTA